MSDPVQVQPPVKTDRPPRENNKPRDQKPREPREPREPRDPKEPREPRQPKEPRDPKEPREQREPREPREPKQPREPREPRQPRSGKSNYVVKGENAAEDGEQVELTEEQKLKQEEQQRKRKEQKDARDKKYQDRQSRFNWDKTLVTLQTVIPELPKKPVEKPVKEDLNKQLDKVEDEIDKQYQHFNKFKEDLKNQQLAQREKNNDKMEKEVKPIGQIIGEKIKLAQAKRAEFKKQQQEFNDYKDQLQAIFNKGQEYRNKMKSLDRPEDILREIAKYKESLKYDKLTAAEEKKCLTQIAQLERSVPYIEPLEKLTKEGDLLKIKQAAIRKVMNAAYDELKVIEDEITQYKGDYETLKDTVHEDKNKQGNPLIEEKRKDRDQKVDLLKTRKQKLWKEYDEQWDQFEDFQELKRYHDWVVRQKEKLIREEEKAKKEAQRKARDEARAKRIAQEEALDKELDEKEKQEGQQNKFQYQIELCEQLLSYCNKLKPTLAEQQNEQRKQVDINQVLKTDEWKKEKVTVLKSKGERDEGFANVANGTNKARKGVKTAQQQQKPQQKQEEVKVEVFHHDINTLKFFDDIRVATPYSMTELDKTIKSIQERKEYYLNPPENAEEDKPKPKKEKVVKQQKDADDFPQLQ